MNWDWLPGALLGLLIVGTHVCAYAAGHSRGYAQARERFWRIQLPKESRRK